MFPLKSDNKFEDQQTSKKSAKDDVNTFKEWINQEETDIIRELFKQHFKFQTSSALLKSLYKTNDKE